MYVAEHIIIAGQTTRFSYFHHPLLREISFQGFPRLQLMTIDTKLRRAINHVGNQVLWLTVVQISTLAADGVCILASIALLFQSLTKPKKGGVIKLDITCPSSQSSKDKLAAKLLSHIDDLGDKEGEDVAVDQFWRTVSGSDLRQE